MSIVKSLAVGLGDMFYIKHNSSNFTIIDCCMPTDIRDGIIKEIQNESRDKAITRFISTHPDQDHIGGLVDLDNAMEFQNFYCVQNEATKPDPTADFVRYCELRDHATKHFYLSRWCSRRWMNLKSEERGQSGINILWPTVTNPWFQDALESSKDGSSPNNISCITKYGVENSATMIWMGDLEADFMESIKSDLHMDTADILFAPHHGRHSGKVPSDWLREMNPKIIVIGEAPSGNLYYYPGYNTITQNRAGNITFDCVESKIHIYVSNPNYTVDFLDNEYLPNTYGKYIGTLKV